MVTEEITGKRSPGDRTYLVVTRVSHKRSFILSQHEDHEQAKLALELWRQSGHRDLDVVSHHSSVPLS